jgi:hypothetical protein
MPTRSRTLLLALTCALPAALGAQTGAVSPTLLASNSVTSEREQRARAAEVAQTREVYVLAFRSGVRQGCRWGAADPLGAALASTKSVALSAPEAERAGIVAALDSAFQSYAKSGSCATLGGATNLVVVDEFHGAAWHSLKSELFGNKGEVTDNGLTVVTRSVKLGSGFFHRVSAEADYTFTTQGGTLVAGRDRVPTEESDAPSRWAAVEKDILDRYPSLLVTRRQSGAPGSSDVTLWRTIFANPDTQSLEITLSAARDAEGRLWITAEYPGLAGR